jgi:hypothetical protein
MPVSDPWMSAPPQPGAADKWWGGAPSTSEPAAPTVPPQVQFTADHYKQSLLEGSYKVADEDDSYHHAKERAADFKAQLQKRFPEVDAEKAADAYEDSVRLGSNGQLLQQHANKWEDYYGSGYTGLRRGTWTDPFKKLPFGQQLIGGAEASQFSDAVSKLNTGQANADAYSRVGQQIGLQRDAAKRGTGQFAFDALTQVPAQLAEWMSMSRMAGAGGSLVGSAEGTLGKRLLYHLGAGVTRAGLELPATVGQAVQGSSPAVGIDEYGNIQKLPGEDFQTSLGKQMASSVLRNVAFQASGVYEGPQGFSLSKILGSTAKGIGAQQFAASAEHYIAGGGGGDVITQYANAKTATEKEKVLKEFAVQAGIFGLLETGLGALNRKPVIPAQPGAPGAQPTAPGSQPATPPNFPVGDVNRQAVPPGQPPPRPEMPRPILDAKDALVDHARKQGWSDSKLYAAMQGINLRFADAARTNPDLTSGQAKELFKDLPEGPLKNLAHAFADEINNRPLGQLPAPAGGQPRLEGPDLSAGPMKPLFHAGPGMPSAFESGDLAPKGPEGQPAPESPAGAKPEAGKGQEWHHSGTEFSGEDNNVFKASDGKEYHIDPRFWDAKTDLGGEHGGVRLGVKDADGNEVAGTVFLKNPDGSWSADLLHVRGELQGKVRGLGRAMYDHMQEAGQRIVPSQQGQTAEGKDFWQKNAEGHAQWRTDFEAAGGDVEYANARRAERQKGAAAPEQPPAQMRQVSLLDRIRAKQQPVPTPEPTKAGVLKPVSEPQPADPEAARRLLRAAGQQRTIERSQQQAPPEEARMSPAERTATFQARMEAKLGDRMQGLKNRVKDATENPTPEKIADVAQLYEYIHGKAQSRGMDPNKFVEQNLPEMKAFHDMADDLLANPEKMPHGQELKDAIEQAAKVAERYGIDQASLRRGVERSLQSSSETVRTAAAQPGVGQPTAGEPENAPAPTPGGAADRDQLGPIKRFLGGTEGHFDLDWAMEGGRAAYAKLSSYLDKGRRTFLGIEPGQLPEDYEARRSRQFEVGEAAAKNARAAGSRLILRGADLDLLSDLSVESLDIVNDGLLDADETKQKLLALEHKARNRYGEDGATAIREQAISQMISMGQAPLPSSEIQKIAPEEHADVLARATAEAKRLGLNQKLAATAAQELIGEADRQAQDSARAEAGPTAGAPPQPAAAPTGGAAGTATQPEPGAAAPTGQGAPGGPTGEPGGGQPTGGGDSLTKTAMDAARHLATNEDGFLDLNRLREIGSQLYDKIGATVVGIHDNLKEFACKMYPRTSREDVNSGNALARMVSAKEFARRAIPDWIDRILPKDITPEDRARYGAAMAETLRFRQAKKAFDGKAMEASHAADALKARADALPAGDEKDRLTTAYKQELERANEYRQKRDAVTTAIGADWSPLKTEADLQAVLAEPGYQQALQKWPEFAQKLDENFRRAQGLEDDDPIDSITQTPGMALNLKALKEGDTFSDGTPVQGSSRGRLQNLPARKYVFAQEAGLDGKVYDPDIGAMMENSLARGEYVAAKAEALRTMVGKELAQWGRPGQKVEGSTEIPFVYPPKGTQSAAAGETSLYVKDAAYGEVRQALQVDQPVSPLPGTQLLTKSSLASTVEVAFHLKNQLTMLMKPYMLRNIIPAALDYFRGKPEFMKDALELARIGSLKPAGFEAQQGSILGSKYNPLTWAGKVLDMTSDVMRVTAGRAFDQMAANRGIFSDQPLVKGTEQNKRDFVNQLGQYNRAGQQKLLVLLRDLGLGPFATAGSNYYMQGLRSLAMDPGVKAGSAANQLQLRAEMVAKTVGVLASVGTANYLMWGNMFGDDKVPLGAIKVGQNQSGRVAYFDLTSLIGLTRGARETGLLALAQGARAGKKPSEIGDKAVDDVVHSLMHPAFGPPAQFAYTAFTGRNSMGYPVAEQVSKATTPQGIAQARALGKPLPGTSQAWLNLVAALKNANPVVGTVGGYNRPGQKVTAEEKVGELMGPFGLKFKK